MKYVYVLNKHGKPLMPTTRFGHVRRLLKKGKAVAVSNNPFVIRLKYDSTHYTQLVYEGLDPGRENIGDAASLEDGKNIYLANVITHNKSIKKQMQDRAGYRRERRRHHRQNKQRRAIHDGNTVQNGNNDTLRTKHQCKSVEISYPAAEGSVTHKVIRGKEGKFGNRKRSEEWLTPSARQLIQISMNEIKQTANILPVTHISIERVAFDFQKLENQDIRKWEYGKGPLYGYKTYKDYIWDEQGGKCACCGKPITQYHHIVPKSKGGTDNVKNIIGTCDGCHKEIHKSAKFEEELKKIKEGFRQKYSAGLLNSVMPALIETIADYCDKHGIQFSVTDGINTSETRKKYNIAKDHCTDAYAISLAGREAKSTDICDTIYQKSRFKKKSNNNINANNQRIYKLNGKIIAYNRHKATDQKEDSLEDFLNNYSKKDIQKLMHEIEILPAKRTYTYHKKGLIAPCHAGDIIKYEKYNKIKGNTKSMIFPAASAEFTEVVRTLKKSMQIKREWKIRIDNMHIRKAKFCKPIASGNLQTTGSVNTIKHFSKIA